MRVTIIVPDNLVAVDGEFHRVDCAVPVLEKIHAVQWRDTKGEIEFAQRTNGTRPANLKIGSFKPFEPIVEAWKEAKAKAAAEFEKREAERAARSEG